MTPEERAANIQAEALRQANQIHLRPSQTQQDVGRRTGPVQREPRIRSQDTGSVFSSAGAATGSRAKSTHAVSGTEELVQQAEGGDLGTVGREASGKVKAIRGTGDKPDATTKKATGRQAKSIIKKDDVIYLSDDQAEEDEGKAVDIEDIDRISISSGADDEGEQDVVLLGRRRINKTPKPKLGLRPVRAARDPFARGDGQNEVYTKVRRKGTGRKQNNDDQGHGDKMDLDNEDDGIAVTAKQTTPIAEEKTVLPSQSPMKRRRKSSSKDTKPQFETIEERAEGERYTSELRKLRNELSTDFTDHPQEDEKSHRADLRQPQDGRLYLFQFPPLTPMLIDPSHQPEIKPEPTADSNAPAAASTVPTEPQVKKEDGVDAKAQPTTAAARPTAEPGKPRLHTAANGPSLPAGLAGKLNVHQSGKVTLEWGVGGSGGGSKKQTNLEVKWGTEVDFLQDVVLASGAEEGVGGGGGGGGNQGRKAWALRQVRNKFVVVPDWGRIYD
jgi:RNA polymerase III RPC4